MKALTRALAVIVLLLIVATVLTYTLPPLLLRDVEAPARISPVVDDARNTIVGNSRQFPRPLHPRLLEVRCFENDFAALYFEEWVPPYIGMSYAVAVGQLDPPDGHRTWEGGYHLDSIGPDSSIERELATLATQLGDEVACD